MQRYTTPKPIKSVSNYLKCYSPQYASYALVTLPPKPVGLFGYAIANFSAFCGWRFPLLSEIEMMKSRPDIHEVRPGGIEGFGSRALALKNTAQRISDHCKTLFTDHP